MIDYTAIDSLQRQISYLNNRNAECAHEIRKLDDCLISLHEAQRRLVQRIQSFEDAINLDNSCMDVLSSKYSHRHTLCVALSMKDHVVGYCQRRNRAEDNFLTIRRELEKAQNACERDKIQLHAEISRNNQSITSLNYSIFSLRQVV